MVSAKSIVFSLAFSSLAAAQYGGSGYGSSGSSSSAAASPAKSSTATTNAGTASSGSVVDVLVGKTGLTFTPSTVNADVGAIINFHFYPSNHSISESSFASPCDALEGGIYSGFMPTSSGAASKMFSVTLSDTKPHWIYCSQTEHCQKGMVMVINPASNSSKTLDAYKSAAESTTSSTSGTTIEGGNLETNVAPSSSSSASASPSSTAGANAAVNATPRNWLALGAGLAFSGIWAAMMA